MSFKAAKCPYCDGDIQVPDNRDTVKCMYCGNDIVVREAIKLAGGVSVENLLILADAALEADNNSEAYNYYTKTLEHDPTNYRAWYGKAISAGWQSTLDNIRLSETITGFENAIKYAPQDNKGELKKVCSSSLNVLCYALYRSAWDAFHSHMTEKSYKKWLDRMDLIIKTRLIASNYNPEDKEVLDSICSSYQAILMDHTTKAYLNDFVKTTNPRDIHYIPFHLSEDQFDKKRKELLEITLVQNSMTQRCL
ncbi:MAG: hypothetical protein KBA50_09720 [Sedimentibacter sp.]|nr:hypothetical protein [Sedimentibacter sp.]